ncbi:hypothetical protein H5410_059729 [Solanum commersonii]|uniref:Uncharacterized protein n=1 Tax=Solanum commersonii TaxID=4109 RepID=A0A9J5W358_SOLCO|nr:hypothetical protein H5410_059729 [Solanum commersonii]
MDLGAFVCFTFGNTDLNVEDMYWHGRRWSGGFQKISQPRESRVGWGVRTPYSYLVKRCKVLYLSNPFPAPVSSTTKDKIMELSSTTSTFADLVVIVASGDPSQHWQKELFAIQYDFLIMKVKSSSLMLMLALFRSWEKLAILIQHSQLFERWDTFRYGLIHCLVRLPAGCCLCFVIASHM